MNTSLDDWLVAYDGTVKHLCQRQKMKHKHNCAVIPSNIKIGYDQDNNPTYLRCLCCDDKIKIETFEEKIKEKIIKRYSPQTHS